MGIGNNSTKIAGNVVEALKTQPLVLALLVLNLLFLVFLVWVLREVSQTNRGREERSDKMFSELQESLRICRQYFPNPSRGGDFRLQSDESKSYEFPPPPPPPPEQSK